MDDGSVDGTGCKAYYAGAYIITHDQSRGIGRSLVEAWQYAIEQGWEWTYQLDAGGSHGPKDTFTLFCFTEPWGDLGVGSRFMKHYPPKDDYIGGSWWRKTGSRVVAGACNFATHQHITDWTSGYRVFSRRALEQLVDVHYLTNMHTWQIEVLHAALQRGLTVAEAPITYRAGRSSFSWRLLDDLIKVYFHVFFSVNI